MHYTNHAQIEWGSWDGKGDLESLGVWPLLASDRKSLGLYVMSVKGGRFSDQYFDEHCDWITYFCLLLPSEFLLVLFPQLQIFATVIY